MAGFKRGWDNIRSAVAYWLLGVAVDVAPDDEKFIFAEGAIRILRGSRRVRASGTEE